MIIPLHGTKVPRQVDLAPSPHPLAAPRLVVDGSGTWEEAWPMATQPLVIDIRNNYVHPAVLMFMFQPDDLKCLWNIVDSCRANGIQILFK